MSWLSGTDLQGLIASGEAALQLSEDVAAAPFGIGNQPGGDLLTLAFEGGFVGAPPAQHAFSLLLLSLQVIESCSRFGDAPLGRNISCCTTFHGKDADGSRRGA